MRHRQEEFQKDNCKFYFLSSDSSLQGGHDYQLTLEDSICAEAAGKLFWDDADGGFDSGTFNSAQLIQTTSLPAAAIGAGNAAVPGKYEAVLCSLKLDVGLSNLEVYGQRIVSFVSDYGTEAKFCEVLRQQIGLYCLILICQDISSMLQCSNQSPILGLLGSRSFWCSSQSQRLGHGYGAHDSSSQWPVVLLSH